MSHKVTAYIADGSLVSQHPEDEVERLLGRSLKWEEDLDSRQTAGKYYSTSWTANITTREAAMLMAAKLDNIDIKKGNNKYVYPIWMTY